MQSVAMAEDDETVLDEKLLQMPTRMSSAEKNIVKWDRQSSLDAYLSKLEAEIIRKVMIEENGNVSKAADALSVKRQTLQHKLKKYKIEH